MKLTYTGHTEKVYVPSINLHATNGEPVEIDDKIAKALLRQSCWVPAEAPEAPKVNLKK